MNFAIGFRRFTLTYIVVFLTCEINNKLGHNSQSNMDFSLVFSRSQHENPDAYFAKVLVNVSVKFTQNSRNI